MGTRRRRAAVLLVLALGALATAGTGASPPPPPAVSASSDGSLTVSPEQPVATVDVVVVANAALQNAPSDSTEVTIRAAAAAAIPGGAEDRKPRVTIAIEALDGDRSSVAEGIASLTSRLEEGCGDGECRRTYRITAAHVDPGGEDILVTWSAAAGSRFGPGTATGSPPPDAKLAIEPARTVVGASDDTSIVLAGPDRVTLDAGHPRTVLHWDVTRPPEGATRGTTPQLLLTVDSAERTADSGRPGTLTVVLGDVTVGSVELGAGPQVGVLDLPRTCREPAGCHESLTATFDWGGGVPDRSVEATATMTGVSFADSTGAIVPFVFGDARRVELGGPSPQLSATTTGTFDAGPGRFDARTVTVVLDARAVPQGGEAVSGVLIGTLTGLVTADGATERTRINLSAGDRGGVATRPGQGRRTSSEVVALDCLSARGTCSTEIRIAAGVGPDDPVEFHVEWTFTATFFSGDERPLPAPLRLDLIVGPART